MPLISGKQAKTKSGFKKNLETELAAGKPKKQALAISYAKARENKDQLEGPPQDFTIDETVETWISKKIEELLKRGYKQKQAEAIAYAEHRKNQRKDAKDSAREIDLNGWPEIKGNPLSKVGVFPYAGSQISPDLDQARIYNVYRPESELTHPDTIESFKLLPWTDEHTMLGSTDEGLTPAEKKGIHGVIGEDVYFEDGYLKGNIKIFSEELAKLIDKGKKELSIGYRCIYEPTSGVYNGENYDFIQREIRGNHLALVDEGRSGHDVAVLDHFKFTFDAKDIKMPDYYNDEQEEKKGDMMKPADRAKDEKIGIKELREMVRKVAEHLEQMSESEDEYEDDLEAEMNNRSENRVEDEEGDPAAFVKKANVTEDEEEPDKDAKKEERAELSKKAEAEGDAKDEDMSKPDGDTGRKEGAMDSMKLVLKEISRRDALANRLAQHIGVFDHKEKTTREVALYGVKKLGLKCQRGYEEATLEGFLKGARTHSAVVHTQDSRPSSDQIDAYLKGSK